MRLHFVIEFAWILGTEMRIIFEWNSSQGKELNRVGRYAKGMYTFFNVYEYFAKFLFLLCWSHKYNELQDKTIKLVLRICWFFSNGKRQKKFYLFVVTFLLSTNRSKSLMWMGIVISYCVYQWLPTHKIYTFSSLWTSIRKTNVYQ